MSTPLHAGVSGQLDQRQIPGVSRLYADYLYDFGRVAKFYPAGPAFDLDRLAQLAGHIAYPNERRSAIATLLRRQNQSWAESGRVAPATEERLRQFAEPDAVAIVTGQQAGLFGGPLLTIYKAMTAVLLAEQLRRRGLKAVPIFWMATQDHDLAEVDHLWVLDANAEPRQLQANFASGSPTAGTAGAPVGDLPLGEACVPLFEDLARLWGAATPALEELRACYRPEATLGSAFAALLSRWFAPWGLIVFDPLTAPEAAAVWAPVYLEVLDRQAELGERLAQRNAELIAAGYHAQVEQTAAATMLFLHRDGARQGLRRRADPAGSATHEPEFLLGERPVPAAEVRAWIRAHPQAVSPAALLRPLLQNLAFPTLAQVSGPAETAYLAQTAALYPSLGASPPLVFPRASVTLLNVKSQRLLHRHGIGLEQVWTEPIEDLLARRALPAEVERQAVAIRANFDREFAALVGSLKILDPTLVDATQGAEQKIHHQLEQLQARVARSLARRGGELAAQARYLAGHLFPRHSLQERLLAAVAGVAGDPGLLSLLHERLDPLAAGHQVIELER